MRIDRTLSLLLLPFFRIFSKKQIPILMYHSVSPQVNHSGHPYFCTEITPQIFENHLKYLNQNGYIIKRLSELPELVCNTSTKNKKQVIITFDDGYRDFFQYALPLLQKYDAPATVFIPPGLIEKGDSLLEDKPLMNWDQINQCFKAGIEIGSHSLTHGVLVELESSELKKEISESKIELENRLQTEITSFAYPYKFPEEKKKFTKDLYQLLKMNNYRTCVTTRIGCVTPGDSFFNLKRIPVNEFDDDLFFRAKLSGTYNWLYYLQYATKLTKGTLFIT